MDAPRRLSTAARDSADCHRCPLELRCWPETDESDGSVPVIREPALRSGQLLWRPGDAFNGPVIVHSGCVMIFRTTPAGGERVTQFALPGDLIGLEALTRGQHEQYAQALGEVLCCRVRWSPGAMAVQPPALTRRLLRRASRMLAGAQHRARHDDPIASVLEFLREIARRLGHEETAAGQRRLRMRLPMSRLDIGHYLGFAEETVCRAIRRLQDRGLIEARGRQISLLEAAWH
jgi:CRP/FNR family transcriptional regulator